MGRTLAGLRAVHEGVPWMKVMRKRTKPKPTMEERVQQILDDAAKYRTTRLARGNVLIQRGFYATPSEWAQRRLGHAERMERLALKLEA